MERIILNGNTFEVHKSNMHNVAPITGCNRDEIFEMYGRPSSTKVAIWRYWCKWCEEMNQQGYECGIEISGHNCNFFSIAGSVRKDGVVYDLWITASRNVLYKHK